MYYIIVENNGMDKAKFTLEVAQDLSKVIEEEEDDEVAEDKFYITDSKAADAPVLFVILFILLALLVAVIVAHFSRSASSGSLLSRLCSLIHPARGLAALRRRLLSGQSQNRWATD